MIIVTIVIVIVIVIKETKYKFQTNWSEVSNPTRFETSLFSYTIIIENYLISL